MFVRLIGRDTRRPRQSADRERLLDLLDGHIRSERPVDLTSNSLRFFRVVGIWDVNSRDFFRQHVRRLNKIDATHLLARFDFPVKLTEHDFDARLCVLKNLIALAPVSRRFRYLGNISGRDRAHVVPMIVAMDQPTKTDLRVIKKILTPEILRTFDRHAARHRADDSHLSFGHFAGSAERDQRLKPRLLERFKKLKLTLIHVQQRVAVRTRYTLGFVWRAQLEWTSAVWTTHLRGGHSSLFSFGCARRCDAEIGERHLLAEENQWRRLVVIDCSKSAVSAGEIGVVISFTGSQQIRNLTFRAERSGAPGFRDHQRRGPWQAVHLLSELELFEGRHIRALRNRILKRDVETSLRFSDPAEPAIGERRVPLVPLPTHFVTELRAAR